jgi:hypothetical protein
MPENMNSYIAERKLILKKSDGKECPITIRIGKPYKVDDVQWSCPVQLEGMYKKLSDQSGVDSFQALMLAQNLVRCLLNSFIEEGGVVLSTEEKNVVNLDALFESGI